MTRQGVARIEIPYQLVANTQPGMASMQAAFQIKTILLTLCIAIHGCSDQFYIQKPFKAGLPDQVFMANFVVEKNMTIELHLFLTGKNQPIIPPEKHKEN